MPVTVPDGLPAIERLNGENIFTITASRAGSQDIRPLRIGILNLMPLKERTETDLLRLLSNTPLQVEVELIETGSYRGTHTPAAHMESFYRSWPEVKDSFYDGFIITGAPVEEMDFEKVSYWEELTRIMDWCRTHVTSTLYICWGALAGLYHHYGIPKQQLEKKISGIYSHRLLDKSCPLFRGFDDSFAVPHSRYYGVERGEIEKHPGLMVMTESDTAGVHCVMTPDGKEIFITGHSEYSPDTLDYEYRRDLAKGLNPATPDNYYIDDDPENGVSVQWRAHAHLLFSNWLNYYVYQVTPYLLGTAPANKNYS